MPHPSVWASTLGALLVLLLSAFPVTAQAHKGVVIGAEPGRFDYYLMTLSWSPSYCVTHAYDERQCGTRGFGFVLHGLWPQYADGGWPEACPGARNVPAAVRNRTLAFMPSERLIDHEWRKHGTCSGLSPANYFREADKAFAKVRIPKPLESASVPQNWTVDDLIRAFREANPVIPEQGIAVDCSGNQLSEVRVCLDRTTLNPTRCGQGVTNLCRPGPLRITPQR